MALGVNPSWMNPKVTSLAAGWRNALKPGQLIIFCLLIPIESFFLLDELIWELARL